MRDTIGRQRQIRCTGGQRQPGACTQRDAAHRHAVARSGGTRSAQRQARPGGADIQRVSTQPDILTQLDGSPGAAYQDIATTLLCHGISSITDDQRRILPHHQAPSLKGTISQRQITPISDAQISVAGDSGGILVSVKFIIPVAHLDAGDSFLVAPLHRVAIRRRAVIIRIILIAGEDKDDIVCV